MILWFAGMAFVGVVLVFNSPALDYRLIMAAALLPAIEVFFGGAWILHTVLGSVVVLTLVMLVLRGRRLAQRRWLALPIGLMAHLVLDATWADKELFWWPAFGFGFGDTPVPEATRSWVVLVLMEVAGAVALWWIVTRYRLTDAERRTNFLRTGRLDRELVGE